MRAPAKTAASSRRALVALRWRCSPRAARAPRCCTGSPSSPATTRAAPTRARCSTPAPTPARSTTSSPASAACGPRTRNLIVDGGASDVLSALGQGREAGRRGRPPRRAHGALLLLLGPRQGRRAPPRRIAAADRRAQGADRRRAGRRADRHPRLLPLGRDHAQQGGAQGARRSPSNRRARATPRGWSSSPPAPRTRTRRSRTPSAAATSRTTWRAACWAAPTSRATAR